MQLVALTIVLIGWRTPVTQQSAEPAPSAAL
jgi:hypothetical protein